MQGYADLIVKFVVTDKGHNVENIKGMLPEGVAQFVVKNEEDVAVKFDREGVYGVKCPPHHGICMIVMIVESTPVNVTLTARALAPSTLTDAEFVGFVFDKEQTGTLVKRPYGFND